MTKAVQMHHFLIDDWLVEPSENTIQRRNKRVHLESKAMDVLCHLSKHPDRIVSSEELLAQCWPDNFMGDSVVYKNIANLRKALGETGHDSKYILTVPKCGYRMRARVTSVASSNIHQISDDKRDFEQALRLLNKITLKQIQNSEFATLELELLKSNSKRLQKISDRLLGYLTGVPNLRGSD